jgi:DNA primase
MDPVIEIKARLPIEDLVRQYAQITKKGRNYVALCPFHHDKTPSLLISPDKGIAYCFPCQKGGDIFSFYQAVEGVDFRQALKDLAERTGVVLESAPTETIKKDERERMRDALEEANGFYRKQLKTSPSALAYLEGRGIPKDQIEKFELGLAPDSFTATYEHMLKAGFSRKKLTGAGLAVQKDLSDERMYDRFRHRLMFPIRDTQGRMIGFGGRTLGSDDAKYLNNSDGPLYHKSGVLYGIHEAKEAMREKKIAIIVEGYFDVLACHRCGAPNTVAACGTALTEEHAKLLKRSVDTVLLCLDSDRAGREAAERGFQILSKEGLQVQGIVLPQKDPADTAQESPELLTKLLQEGGMGYIDLVLAEMKQLDLTSPRARIDALRRLLPLLQALPSAVERTHYVTAAAGVLGTTETALEEDMASLRRQTIQSPAEVRPATDAALNATLFSTIELTMGLFVLYPKHRGLLQEVIAPEEGMAAALYQAIKEAPAETDPGIESLPLGLEHRERVAIMLLYCEQQGFSQWNDSIAIREIRRNCANANRELIRRKQQEITRLLVDARRSGKAEEEQLLQTQYQQLLKLSKLAS